MEPRIGHWHCRYRPVAAQPAAAVAVERIERAVRPRVTESYAAALDHAFADDPAVYVLRRVNVRLALNAARTEESMAREWGQRLGAAVVRGVMGGDDGGNLIRFADEADYVAHFISDLLDGVAWERWYYGAFSKLKGKGRDELILALLLERRESLGELFGRLSQLGCLERALGQLGGAGASRFWAALAPSAVNVEPHTFRVFVRGALRLLDLLGLWAATAPAESKLLEGYAAERPAPPDWRDRQSLATAVLSVVRHASRRAYVTDCAVAEVARRLAQSRARIQTEFDWLDVEWLLAALPSALARETAGGDKTTGGGKTQGSDETAGGETADVELTEAAVLHARAAGVTPFQRRLIELARTLLLEGRVRLDPGRANSSVNATRLYAALSAADAELAARPAAASLVERLLLCAEWCASTPEPARTLAAVRAGRDAATKASGRQPQEALRALLTAGPETADVLDAIVRQTRALRAVGEETVLQTECAGLFLVLRAVLDVRLPQLVKATGAGPLSSVLLALGIQWAGEGAVREGEIDEGLAFWCGLGPSPGTAAEVLSALDEEGCRRLLAEVKKLVEARRAVHPSMTSPEESPPEATLAALTAGWPPDVAVSNELVLVASYALRLWAQWLPGIPGSSVPYLLRQLLRRGGELRVGERRVEVRLRPGPMDVVLEMASYTKELPAVSWLADRKIIFRIDRSRA
ncbi:MAG TPA: hypothetical protein VF297_26845 [Pyrinomonadaceae bacterium]